MVLLAILIGWIILGKLAFFTVELIDAGNTYQLEGGNRMVCGTLCIIAAPVLGTVFIAVFILWLLVDPFWTIGTLKEKYRIYKNEKNTF